MGVLIPRRPSQQGLRIEMGSHANTIVSALCFCACALTLGYFVLSCRPASSPLQGFKIAGETNTQGVALGYTKGCPFGAGWVTHCYHDKVLGKIGGIGRIKKMATSACRKI